MFCSNQVFSISGHDKKELNLAIKYALNYGATIKEYTPCCFKIDPVFGIVFYFYSSNASYTLMNNTKEKTNGEDIFHLSS